MDPLSIVGTSFALAGSIAKTAMVLTKFSGDFRDSRDDLMRISSELQAIATILDPLTRVLSRSLKGGLPQSLIEQVDNTLTGCVSAVAQVEAHVEKYQHDKIWTKTKWVVFGQEDMQKLRESLEVYKMALNIGLQAISLNLGQDIKDDTEVLRAHVETVKFNTDEILARIETIRQTGPSFQSNSKVNEWIENMAVLSTYAESTYKETIVDAAEFTIPPYPEEGMAPHPNGIDWATHEAPARPPQPARLRPAHPTTSYPETVSEETDDAATVVNYHEDDHARNAAMALETVRRGLRGVHIDDQPSTDVPVNLQPRHNYGSQPSGHPHGKPKLPTVYVKNGEYSYPDAALDTISGIPARRPTRKPSPNDFPSKPLPTRRDNGNSFPNSHGDSLASRAPVQRPLIRNTSIRQSEVGAVQPWPNRILFDGIQDMANDIKRVASRACPDWDLIRASRVQREKLSDDERRRLDDRLERLDSSTPAEFIRDTIARGADPNAHEANSITCKSLDMALRFRNEDCVFALLECGADPNTGVEIVECPVRDQPYQSALAYAAWVGKQALVWALLAAGAMVNPPDSAVHCPACTGSIVKACTTPLLRAIDESYDPGLHASRNNIVRFLLANRADPNAYGCEKVGTAHQLHSPLSLSILSSKPHHLSNTMTQLLLEAGAVFRMSFLPIRLDIIDKQNPLYHAVTTRNMGLFAMLDQRVTSEDSKYWKRAISCAASYQAWDCISFLLTEPFIQMDYLHYLIQDCMRGRTVYDHALDGLGWDSFSKAAEMLLDRGFDPTRRLPFTYKRKTKRFWSQSREVTEDVSPLELVERIATAGSRSYIRDLLLARCGSEYRYLYKPDID
ncbi:hypothetical protein B0T10DRAFT_565532 [Thelonectria olida]|uniref:Azaphilone pigments biosynthesis cluster protein L N-terminal domain-containing protein n=1 Tax=Thelonectria olida TaxID=1576542 RepID=A0A9P8VYQ0_9HYPO|nr:hypothetical protein B0T10DRAFT_565532 [Thelonectria olida]